MSSIRREPPGSCSRIRYHSGTAATLQKPGRRMVSVDWDGYEIYDPGVSVLRETLPRREARQGYNRLMAARPARIEVLRRVLKANGGELGGTGAAAPAPDAAGRARGPGHPRPPQRRAPR